MCSNARPRCCSPVRRCSDESTGSYSVPPTPSGRSARSEPLSDSYGLVPDAVSGLIANSPLGVRELIDNVAVATFDATKPDLRAIARIFLGRIVTRHPARLIYR